MPTAVSGLVLAAGGSSRLGRPKQLLPFGEATLLDHTLDVARACGFDQLVCVLGGGAEDVRAVVDLDGVDVVVNEGFGSG
jgi:molybdenum cofactor cytidylyltransferase